MNQKAMIAGAVSGFVAAFVVDLHAWRDSVGGFNWRKAAKRWVSGAISGALMAAGFGGVVS